jgi:hypothetical protein
MFYYLMPVALWSYMVTALLAAGRYNPLWISMVPAAAGAMTALAARSRHVVYVLAGIAVGSAAEIAVLSRAADAIAAITPTMQTLSVSAVLAVHVCNAEIMRRVASILARQPVYAWCSCVCSAPPLSSLFLCGPGRWPSS